MSGFSSAWLSLREAADHRSRDAALAETLSGRFALRDSVTITDIGCGTGSNLRATAALLPMKQNWTLVDYDPALLSAAREKLSNWADEASTEGEHLLLVRGPARISVCFREADLAADLETGLGPPTDLITAAAFFDLASKAFIRNFAQAVATRGAVFYTVLTYNGRCSWQPRHPADNAVTAAFHRHQLTDKGFGVSTGPTAPLHLSDQFKLAGYSVQEADSPWRLTPSDEPLLAELQAGHQTAVAETGAVEQSTLQSWASRKLTGAVIGHTDTLAIPV
jgi:SAM-dependent methyltransferase